MELRPVTKKIIAFGSKQVFLPKFTVALIRTPKASPYTAKFRVPLTFSKYDLRDYLYHAYSVRVHSIRSLVKQLPVRDHVAAPRRWFRPESEKYMMVELERPFVWPEHPKDWAPWGSEEKTAADKQSVSLYGAKDDDGTRGMMREARRQAVRVLEGRGVFKRQEEEVKEEAKEEGEAAQTEVKMSKREAKRAAKKAAIEEAKEMPGKLQKEWAAKRTPQILWNEQLDSENFASLRVTKPKDDEDSDNYSAKM